MPIHVSHSPHQRASAAPDFSKEISKLRSEMEALRKQKPSDPAESAASSKLPLYLAGLSLLVSIIALFRH